MKPYLSWPKWKKRKNKNKLSFLMKTITCLSLSVSIFPSFLSTFRHFLFLSLFPPPLSVSLSLALSLSFHSSPRFSINNFPDDTVHWCLEVSQLNHWMKLISWSHGFIQWSQSLLQFSKGKPLAEGEEGKLDLNWGAEKPRLRPKFTRITRTEKLSPSLLWLIECPLIRNF